MTRELEHLAKAYFHQDYDVTSGTPDNVICDFKLGETPESIEELITDIQQWLDSPMSETDIGNVWIKGWYASYNPARDGITYREWFTHVLQLLQTPMST